MKKRITLIIAACLVFAVFWPWLGNPFNYLHLKDSVRTSIPVALIFGEPCATYHDGTIGYDTSPNCYRFDQSKLFKGIWLYEFEGSAFLENVSSVPTKRPVYGDTAWLMYDPAAIDPQPDYNGVAVGRDCSPIRAFQIEFIGRRSQEGHGHMGLFDSAIWVQKMLSAKPLSAPDCEKY